MIKISSSSLTHTQTEGMNPIKIEKLARVVSDSRGQGKDMILVSSGAIVVGRQALDRHRKPDTLAKKRAFATTGQTRLMMIYQKLFAEYSQTAVQALLTKDTMVSDSPGCNAQNIFDEPLNLGTIPVVNESSMVSTPEIPCVDNFGGNDRLSVIMAALIGAGLLVLLPDIDDLYTNDPRENPETGFISPIPEATLEFLRADRDTSGSDVSTGGMLAKLAAARIATDSGADMVIASGDQVDAVLDIMSDKEKRTLFLTHTNLDFDLIRYLNDEY